MTQIKKANTATTKGSRRVKGSALHARTTPTTNTADALWATIIQAIKCYNDNYGSMCGHQAGLYTKSNANIITHVLL
jgi:hypothetical protein